MVAEQGDTSKSLLHERPLSGSGATSAKTNSVPLPPTSSSSLAMPSVVAGTTQPMEKTPDQLNALYRTSSVYDPEWARMEAWLDENPEFAQDYFIRKATRQTVDAWLVHQATPSSCDLSSPTHFHTTVNCPSGNGGGHVTISQTNNCCSSRAGSGATTPVR